MGRVGTRKLTDSISGAELGAGVSAPSDPDAEGKWIKTASGLVPKNIRQNTKGGPRRVEEVE